MRPPQSGFKPGRQLPGLLFGYRRSALTGEVLCKQFLKGHTMHKSSRKKSPLELADLILKHNPGASMEMIENVISEWGGLFDDHRHDVADTNAIEGVIPIGQPKPDRFNSEFR
jgi:hypothetical protein